MDPQVFIDIQPEAMRAQVESYHARKWRFVNICGSTVADGVELIYSFSNGEPFENLRFVVPNGAELPSVSDLYLNSFFFENETHDLFGVQYKGIAIDFHGKFYDVSVPTPMNPGSVQAASEFLQCSSCPSEIPIANEANAIKEEPQEKITKGGEA